MFDDRYCLTDGAIKQRKKETRRNELTDKEQAVIQELCASGERRPYIIRGCIVIREGYGKEVFRKPTRYSIGEIVSVAQNYNDAGINSYYIVSYREDGTPVPAIQSPGWTNKMFTRADLMPHQIQITDIRIELLQEITDESCLREGVRYEKELATSRPYGCSNKYGAFVELGSTPREAFSALINKVSGRGTWESNPYVVVYGFELVK